MVMQAVKMKKCLVNKNIKTLIKGRQSKKGHLMIGGIQENKFVENFIFG